MEYIILPEKNYESMLNCTSHIYSGVYLLDGAVALGIPLLRVQADYDPLPQEEGSPHDDVPDGSLSPVVQDEVEHHWQETWAG